MRIAINALAARRGGGVNHLRHFTAAMAETRPAWDYVVFVADDAAAAIVNPIMYVERVHLSNSAARLSQELLLVDRRARQLGFDCMLNLLNSGAPRPTVPTITWQRNPIYFDRTWLQAQTLRTRADAFARRTLALLMSRRSSFVVVPSTAMGAYVRSWRLGRNLPLRVIPHGVEAREFSERTTIGDVARTRQVVVGVMGHAAAHRGLDVAVRAAAEAQALGLDIELHFTIDRYANPSFQHVVDDAAAIADELGVALCFDGPVSDQREWYGSLEVLLITSRTESFCFPLIEGLAAGVPVVASDILPLLELGQGAVWFAKRGDPRDFGRTIKLAVEAPDQVKERRRLLGRRIAQQATWEEYCERVAELIEHAVQM